MPLEFRRGKDAIEQSKKNSQSSGDFTPFLPNIYWKDDKQSKYLWILNPAEDIPTVKVINPFTSKGRPEMVVSRQDAAIGRSSDPIEDEWGYGPTDNGICIAVVLEPVTEVTAKGHTRPKAFRVKTRDFERRVKDDDGKLTDEKEKVSAPEIGIICQSPMNFFNAVSYRDTNIGPINEFPLEITRLGTGTETTYNVDVFENQPLEMDGLLDNWDGISYLTEEEKDDLESGLSECEDDLEASILIGNVLLDKWLDEHASQEWYDSILKQIDRHAKFPSKKYLETKGESKREESSAPSSRVSSRRTRPSQRRAAKEEASAEEPEATEPEPVAEEPAEAPKAKRNRRKATEPVAEAPEVTKQSPVKERLEEIVRQNAEARAKRATAAA